MRCYQWFSNNVGFYFLSFTGLVAAPEVLQQRTSPVKPYYHYIVGHLTRGLSFNFIFLETQTVEWRRLELRSQVSLASILAKPLPSFFRFGIACFSDFD
ncbi:hypothetical protein IGI04_015634 [Brassica rapa subsp. trilocularis]|uniref:Secreted protein n=1 Tax=Brassica rapa subsp. trilocularis TaxID=1813537 RepID=A0ABQ7MQL6_BRACM|nr:hypothetical protein IGI04_015634 [Brassica rapa subsp. trilocularis]